MNNMNLRVFFGAAAMSVVTLASVSNAAEPAAANNAMKAKQPARNDFME